MRVLQLNKRYWPHVGGIERHLRDLASGLARQAGVHVSALACRPGRPAITQQDGVRLRFVPSFGTWWSVPVAPGYPVALAQELALSPDVLHLHAPFPLGVISLLACTARRPRPPVVITWHSDIIRQRAALAVYAPFERHLLARASAVIVPTERHVGASRFLPAVAEKCRVVPFGIDAARFQTLAAIEGGRRLRQQHGSERIVLFVGRLVYYKGLPCLIQAMRHINATLLIAGDGRDRAALQRLVRRAGLAGRVRFLGMVTEAELPALYHACDVFVLPSVAPSEGFGIVQLEAMAAGRPVVSTALPTGVATVNVHGQTGLVVPPADAGALAEALQALLDQPNLAQTLGRQARQRVLERYTLPQMVEGTLAVYREAIAPHRSG